MINNHSESDLKRHYSDPEAIEEMRISASLFLTALTPAQRSICMFSFDAESERSFWHYTPVKRRGLPLKKMDQTQRKLAHDLLASGLSKKGLVNAQATIDHEKILDELEKRKNIVRFNRDSGLYFFSIFGNPSRNDRWSWRMEGHHLSLHFTIVNNSLLTTMPFFFGANPARVPAGPIKGLRILSRTEDLARDLFQKLSKQQRLKALINDTAPRDIFTTNARHVAIDKVEGLSASVFSNSERESLMTLIKEYLSKLRTSVALREESKLVANGFDKIHFAWAGGQEPRQPHYYRIHGPSFLVEYDCVQDGANHIHSVWRDLENDFGFDILRLHHQKDHSDN